MIIVADTSALYAAFDAGQPEHKHAVSIVEHDVLAISPLVVTELDHLVHGALGFDASVRAMDAINARMANGQYKLSEIKPADLAHAHQIRSRYAALRLDLADAIGVLLADRYETDRILTLDQRDYRAITPLTRGFDAFRILPADR